MITIFEMLGCMSDGDCGECQYCDLRRFHCRPRMCDCNLYDLNAVYPKMSVAASCKQTLTVACNDGYIYSQVPGPNETTIGTAKTLTLVRTGKNSIIG